MNTRANNTIDNSIDSFDSIDEQMTIAELWEIDRAGKNYLLNVFVKELQSDVALSSDSDVIAHLHKRGGRSAAYIGSYQHERAYRVALSRPSDIVWVRYDGKTFSCRDFVIEDYDFGKLKGKASYWWHINASEDSSHGQDNPAAPTQKSRDNRRRDYTLKSEKKYGSDCPLRRDYKDSNGVWWMQKGGQRLCCDPETATKISSYVHHGDDCMSFYYAYGTIYQAPEGHYFEIGEGQCGSKWAELEEGSCNSWVGGTGCLLV